MAVLQLARKIRDLFRSQPTRPAPRQAKLHLQSLEERCVPAGNATGTLNGVVFADVNRNGVRDSGELKLVGVNVTLTGRTNLGANVNVSTTTNSNGNFRFLGLQPGTYKARGVNSKLIGTHGSNVSIINVPAVAGGQTANVSIRFLGLAPSSIGLRQFLASTTNTNTFTVGTAGPGVALASARENSRPIVKTGGIPAINVTQTDTSTPLDLAGFFDDVDLTNSRVQLVTNRGNINIDLFDKTAPRTVANFFNYITSNRYDNTIFHRLAANFVLQGGGFQFNRTGTTTTLPNVPADPSVQNEFGRSNTLGTVAMAKLPSNPDTATNQFFFNLANNTNLDTQNGGFTVFGQLASAADRAIVTSLSQLTRTDASGGDPNSPFNEVPTANYPSATNFPTDLTAANVVLLQDVKVIKRDEFLRYSIVSNTNTALVTPTITNNRINLVYADGVSGSATITVRATDRFGATVDTTIAVTRT
jgi:cyclophilin family peptidyl-prolyl cis-trans isomerase